MSTSTTLPDSVYYQYISHLYHGNVRIPWAEYTPTKDWDYPDYERDRLSRIFLGNLDYFQGKRILDLGCLHGYMLYIAHTLGSTTLSGINVRKEQIDAGQFFFDQMGIPVNFHHDTIENFVLLEQLCNQHDTVLAASIFQHLPNPEMVLRIISRSNVKNMVIELSTPSEDDTAPRTYYRLEEGHHWNFGSFDPEQTESLVCTPNLRFFEVALYHYKWRITNIDYKHEFRKEHFAQQNLKSIPRFKNIIVISAEKF